MLKQLYQKLLYRNYQIQSNYTEIYNEIIYDLLSDHKVPLNLREDVSQGVYIENVTHHLAQDYDTALKLMQKG